MASPPPSEPYAIQSALQITEDVLQWIKDNPKYPANEWFDNNCVKMYIRRRKRVIEGQFVNSLDLATIEVEPTCRRQGVLTYVLERLHSNNPYDVTYVENILNPVVEHTVDKLGWQRDPGMSYDKSYYKRTSHLSVSPM